MSRSDFGQYVGWWRRLDVLSQAASATEIDTRRQNQSNKIRFKDAEFDFVTVAVYFTMGHQRRGLRWPREVVRVLGPGGVFPVLERNPYNPVTRLIVSRTPRWTPMPSFCGSAKRVSSCKLRALRCRHRSLSVFSRSRPIGTPEKESKVGCVDSHWAASTQYLSGSLPDS